MVVRAILAIAVLGLTVAGVAAQQDPIAARKALMKGNDSNAGILFRMVRGREPFDAAKVDAAYAQFVDTAQKLPALFPDNAKPRRPLGDYSASLRVWQNRSDFNAKIADFAKTVAEGRDKVKTLDGLKTAFGPLGQACDNCHELYRVKN